MKPEESILLKKIQKGDIKAFEILYKDYHPRMFGYAKRFIADPEVIKDILQELFSDFWNRKEEWSIEISIRSFLFRMLHNRCIDQLRKQAIHDNFASLSSLRLSEIKYRYFDFEEDPFPSIFMAEINEIVEKVIDNLSPQTKEIFQMSRNKGLKNSEIAEEMNLSVRTVEKHIYQTLKILKTRLADYK
ncbi:MAG: RNA polymerase sigma-70 factor [Candidatus Symbiothrix sp.]|jgi:RNA polymerase sigma-70 factor (ECF subfamily)|nr:RNA polymerase sigma-70 factor [Candidatus Symbiothrix sp.]